MRGAPRESSWRTRAPPSTFAAIPEERYEWGRRPFDRGHGLIRSAPVFHTGRSVVLQPCQDGYEALESTFRNEAITRIFVGSDWSLYVRIAHPFRDEHGRVTVRDFCDALPDYLS